MRPLRTYNPHMGVRPKGQWTPEEVARSERANQERMRHDKAKTPAERLEETIRLSKFIDELRHGA